MFFSIMYKENNRNLKIKKQNKSKLAVGVQHSEVIGFVVIALSGT